MVFEMASVDNQQVVAKQNYLTTGNYEVIAKDPVKHIMTFIEKKVRNLDKRMIKLDGYRQLVAQGETLDADREAAAAKYDEVVSTLNFAKELRLVFSTVSVEIEKVRMEHERNEEKLKKENVLERSRFVAQSLIILRLLTSQEKIQEDFLNGENNAVELEQNELDLLLRFCNECLKFTVESGDDLIAAARDSGEHLNRLFAESKDGICGSTYARIKTVVTKIYDCDYFTHFPAFPEDKQPESRLEEPDAEEVPLEVASSVVDVEDGDEGEKLAKTGIEFSSRKAVELNGNYNADEIEQPALDVVDSTPFISEPDHLAKSEYKNMFDMKPAMSDRSLIEAHLQQQNQASFMSFQFEDPADETSPPENTKPHRPAQTIEEVLADVQGEYNFLQDSMLELDKEATDGRNELTYENSYKEQSVNSNSPNVTLENNIVQAPEAHQTSQFNSVDDSLAKDDSYLQTVPSASAENAANMVHPSSSLTNNLYSAPTYSNQENIENYAATGSNLGQVSSSQLKQKSDNLGMGQTTFGSNEQSYQSDIEPASQYTSKLHSMEQYPNQPDINMIKTVPENTYSTSPFSSLHGNSQPPFENSLPSNAIPEAILMPSSNPTMSSQSLSTPDPPTTHIPFPNDKMSGYRSYTTSAPAINPQTNSTGMNMPQDEPSAQYASLPEKQQPNTLMSAGDAEHISPSGLKQDPPRNENIVQNESVKVDQKETMPTGNRGGGRKNSSATTNQQMNRNNRTHNSGGFQNSSQQPLNYNRGNMVRQQGQNMGGSGFYSNRGNNYRTAPNRGYGNFDSMGHPKHFPNSGGGYQQHPQGGNIPPFNGQYNRQVENPMYGGMSRRVGGSNRGNRGYPSRVNNMRNNGGTNYNRSRTYRPQNSEQAA